MNASVITDDVQTSLRRLYGLAKQLGTGNVFVFGESLTCSINYSKRLRGDKYFFAVPRLILGSDTSETNLPTTQFGEFVVLICGSANSLLVLPRLLVVEMLTGVPSRRVDIFEEAGRYILQTTRHAKLDVTEYLNALPSHDERGRKSNEATDAPNSPDRLHVKMQWSLIALGRAEGCQVWVPINDRNLMYKRQAFSSLTLVRLPNFGFAEGTRRIIENIDVLWVTSNIIRSAFEIESTTTIYSGLLRLNDLVLSQPNNQIKLFVAATQKRRANVQTQLMRPTFQRLIPTCQFISFEAIEEQTTRLQSLGVDRDTRVSGLIRGERFMVPEDFRSPE